MIKKRIKKCELCNKELNKSGQCMSCDQELIMKAKVKEVMHEFKEHNLHARSLRGPLVTSREQAIAIALNQGRKAVKKNKK